MSNVNFRRTIIERNTSSTLIQCKIFSLRVPVKPSRGLNFFRKTCQQIKSKEFYLIDRTHDEKNREHEQIFFAPV